MLLAMIEQWKAAVDSGLTVGAIFIDFKKAFDTVSHNVLSSKLQAFGICGHLHGWIMHYLTNRKQYTELNGTKSSTLNVDYGVPPGSLVGPRLFTIYVNELPESINAGKVFMYADDTTIYCTGTNFEDVVSKLNSIMDQISLWSVKNKLTIHPSKSEAMIIRKSPFIGPLCPVRYGSAFVNFVTSTTCLGVTIDNKLSWSAHIEKVNKNFSNKVCALKRMCHLPQPVLQDIYYFKTIIPCVTYAIAVCGPHQPYGLP
ncbi:RNA-directed DNA polymerase from mobile element jockey [Stylophora pistillata]|uniref:RNA-directed DNA polymerase from mobile element jockey n=1 Tax=Stylophora pistillata TaxID=50429 RepID=A0A2B4SFY9_STYPI|nr:RNA-directed DNA polymerase from mobile element jockey [Stylophora pistillata]